MKEPDSIERRQFLQQAGVLTITGVLGCDAGDSIVLPEANDVVANSSDLGLGDVSRRTDVRSPVDTEMRVDVERQSPDTGPPDLPEYEYTGELGPETLFSHGVASGDPLQDAVILWTRVTLDAADSVEVWWEISLAADFSWRVAYGTLSTDSTRDYTAKVDVTGLEAGTTYYYRFFALGRESVTGRTRTAPSGQCDHLRLAVASCSNYSRGDFSAYKHIAERADLDAVIHLGDYIY